MFFHLWYHVFYAEERCFIERQDIQMKFAEKVHDLRKKKHYTQDELAKLVGVSKRTLAGYEGGNRYPKQREVYRKLADVLDCDVNYLLAEDEAFIADAADLYGTRGKEQAEEAVNVLSGLFAGGELSDTDRDAVMRALQEAYWNCKEDNRKYTPFHFKDDLNG